jgi:hypothetical protein
VAGDGGRREWPLAVTRTLGCLLCVFLASCCVTAPPAEKFFKRDKMNPYWTLRAFVYAVDTRQWEFAYETLTEESRAEFGSQTRFSILVGAIDVDLRMVGPDPVRVSIYELVSSALGRQRDRGEAVGPNGWQLATVLQARSARGQLVGLDVDLFLRLDPDKVWRLDLRRTMAELQARLPAPAG